MVPSETRKRQKEARDKLACEINDAVDVFMKTLDNLADKHGQCVTLLPFGNIASLTPNFLHSKRSYVHDLAGTVCAKVVTKQHTTPYAAFIAMKLEAENRGVSS